MPTISTAPSRDVIIAKEGFTKPNTSDRQEEDNENGQSQQRPGRPSFVRPINVPEKVDISMGASSWGSSVKEEEQEPPQEVLVLALETNDTTTTTTNTTNTTSDNNETLSPFLVNFDNFEINNTNIAHNNTMEYDSEVVVYANETLSEGDEPNNNVPTNTTEEDNDKTTTTWTTIAPTFVGPPNDEIAPAPTPTTTSSSTPPAPAPGAGAGSAIAPTLPVRPIVPTESPTFDNRYNENLLDDTQMTATNTMTTVEGITTLVLHGLYDKIPQNTDIELVFTMAIYEFIESALIEAPIYLQIADVHLVHQQVISIPNQLRRNRRELSTLYLRTLEQQLQEDFQALQVEIQVVGTPTNNEQQEVKERQHEHYQSVTTREHLEQALYDLFHRRGREFLDILKEASWAQGESFFADLVAVEPKQLIIEDNSNSNNEDTLSSSSSSSTWTDSTPTDSPYWNTGDMSGSSITSTTMGANGESSNGEGIPLLLVIGAAVACGVLVILLVGVACYVKKSRNSSGRRKKIPSSPNEVGATSMSSDEQMPPAQRLAATMSAEKKKHKTQGIAGRSNSDDSSPQANVPESLRSSDQDSDTSSSLYLPSNLNNINANPYGYAHSSGPDIEDDLGGAGDFSVMDNNSYAYSLEPGFSVEPSVMAGLPSHIIPSSSQSIGASYSLISAQGGGSGSVTSGTSSFAFMNTKSKRKNTNLIKREIIAPSGKLGTLPRTKQTLFDMWDYRYLTHILFFPPILSLFLSYFLGIVIDTTLDGPVVHKVNPGSALEGKLWSGDLIVAIDDVDTRAMNATSITALMVKTANQRRKLTILSDPSHK